jgi:hypothetical protein
MQRRGNISERNQIVGSQLFLKITLFNTRKVDIHKPVSSIHSLRGPIIFTDKYVGNDWSLLPPTNQKDERQSHTIKSPSMCLKDIHQDVNNHMSFSA